MHKEPMVTPIDRKITLVRIVVIATAVPSVVDSELSVVANKNYQ